MVWCSHCRRPGHWTSQCYSKKKQTFCTRCGRNGHSDAQCYATYDVDDECLEDDEDDCWACSFCDRTFDTEQGAQQHESRWCSKRPGCSSKVTPAHVLRDSLRRANQQSTRGVYVLKLDDGCVYVGKSENVDDRIDQHRSGNTGQSAKWCSIHGTQHAQRMSTKCPPSGDDLDTWEKNETLVQMMHHGVDNVRGWAFTNKVLTYEQLVTIKTLIIEQADVCRACGHQGHFVSACKSRNIAPWLANLQKSIDTHATGAARRCKRPLPETEMTPITAEKRTKATTTAVADSTTKSFTERAKSGRSICKTCSQHIAKGEWRRGTERAHPTYGILTSFVHLACHVSN